MLQVYKVLLVHKVLLVIRDHKDHKEQLLKVQLELKVHRVLRDQQELKVLQVLRDLRDLKARHLLELKVHRVFKVRKEQLELMGWRVFKELRVQPEQGLKGRPASKDDKVLKELLVLPELKVM